jgi:hypothetical protein
MRIIKCDVYPKLLYGAETRTVSKKLEKIIEALEMWIYRCIGHVSWTVKKNNDVLHQVGLKRVLMNDMRNRKAAYFCHIIRHTSILKEI